MADPLAQAATWLAVVPPGLVLVAGAAAVAALPRRTGSALAVGLALAVTAWIGAIPPGQYLQTRLFGFDVTLLAVDPLSRTVALVLAFVAAAALAYGHGTAATRRQQAHVAAYLGAGVGATLAGDWLTLVLWWEALAVAATALVWTSGDAAASRAGLRYAVYHEVGGLALLAAVVVHLRATGSLALAGGLASGWPALLGAAGIGVNVAVVGLHPWLVDTYPRPHVATSVALAACTTKVGVYALARAFPDGGPVVAWGTNFSGSPIVPDGPMIAYVGAAMLLVGVTYAILQTDVRRLLAYHIVSQVGIMVAGVGIGSPLAVAGAFAHLVNNVLYKSLLFAVAGVLVVRTGESNLKRLGGLAEPLPRTFVAFLVAALAISGVPGFNGFVSKGMVFDAAEDAGLDLLWWLLLVGSVGTVISFAKFGYYAFLRGGHGEENDGGPGSEVDEAGTATAPADAGPAESLALVLLAVPCVVFGLAPGLLFSVLPGSTATAKPFAPSQFAKAGAILGAGGVAFLVLRGPLGRVAGAPDLDSIYHPLGAWLLGGVAGVVGGVGARVDALVGRVAEGVVHVTSKPDLLAEYGLADRSGPVADSDRATDAGLAEGGDDGIGRAVLLVVLTLVLVLVVLLV